MATTTVFAQDYFLILGIHFVCTDNAEMWHVTHLSERDY
jgi:hypothetical protein